MFDAFISYSHAADGKLAAAIQHGLHRFAKPLFKRRAIRVFRDETTLAMTPQLWPEIEKALRSSRFLILMADPHSAQSEWVQKEVACWVTMKRTENMLIVWTGGDLFWDKARKDFAWDKTTALSALLAGAFEGEEPLYQDLRWTRTEVDLSRKHPGFATALAKLSAPIRGRSLDEIFGEDVREQRRTRMFMWAGITVLLLASAFAGWRWWGEFEARQDAETQTKAAAAARDQADGLINFMLHDLRAKLEPVGRLDVLDDVAKKAKEYLDKLPKELLTASRLSQRAALLRNLGDVLEAQGKLPEALDSYQQGSAIFKRLAQQDKTSSGWQLDLSSSYEKVGEVLEAQGKLVEALAAYQQNLTITKRLVEQDKTNSVWRRDLWVSYDKVGDGLAAQGKLADALAAYQQGLTIASSLAQQDKTNSGWQRDLSVSYDKVGEVLEAQGKLPDALAAYQQDLAITKGLAEQDKTNSGWQRDLSVSYEKVGEVLEAQRKLVEALAAYQQSLTIRQMLAEQDKTNSRWQRDLSVSYEKVGEVLEAQGKLVDALNAYQQSSTIAKRLAEQDENNTDWQRGLSITEIKSGDVLVAQGKLPQALDSYQKSLKIAKGLVEQDKTNSGWQRDLSLSYERVGDVLKAQDKLPEALDAYQQTLTIAKRLAEQEKANVRWQRDLILCLYRVGMTTARMGTVDSLEKAQGLLRADLELSDKYSGPDRQELLDAINQELKKLKH